MRFANRMDCLQDKALLNAMELTEADGMISFSAGSPSPETYPVKDIKEAFIRVLDREGKEALRYCSTSGYSKLREIIVKRMHQYGDRVRMIYVIPDFQNPTGRSWSRERRIEFVEFISACDIPVIEDAAYAELSFEDKMEAPLSHYDNKGQVA